MYGIREFLVLNKKQRLYVAHVCSYMTIGLGLSCITMLCLISSSWLNIFLDPVFFYIIICLLFLLILSVNYIIDSITHLMSQILFCLNSILMGLFEYQISYYFFSEKSMILSLVMSAIVFYFISILSKKTKINLLSFIFYGILCCFGTFLLLLTALSSKISLHDCSASIIIFNLIFISCSINMLKVMDIYDAPNSKTIIRKMEIKAAFFLYLNFISIFLKYLEYFDHRTKRK